MTDDEIDVLVLKCFGGDRKHFGPSRYQEFARIIEQVTRDAAPIDAIDAARDAVIEECAMVCRRRINGTRRVADLEAAECMRGIRALTTQSDKR
jgi:hypothetical protein